jgi:hypothetical protein
MKAQSLCIQVVGTALPSREKSRGVVLGPNEELPTIQLQPALQVF